MHPRFTNPTSQPRAAFTLTELLVVLAIIAILIGLVFTAGTAAVRGGKERATLDTIRALDAAMQAYIEEREQVRNTDPITLAFNPTNVETMPGGIYEVYPIIDARAGDSPNRPIIDTVGLWMTDARRYSRVKEILDKIPPKFVREWDMDIDGMEPMNSPPAEFPTLTTIVDAWGKPIRLVLSQTDGLWVEPDMYPAGQGTEVDILVEGLVPQPLPQDGLLRSVRTAPDVKYKFTIDKVRRNWVDQDSPASGANGTRVLTDSDGGRCDGPRPYFYSAGPDGEVGLKKQVDGTLADLNTDNLYLHRPKFARKP